MDSGLKLFRPAAVWAFGEGSERLLAVLDKLPVTEAYLPAYFAGVVIAQTCFDAMVGYVE